MITLYFCGNLPMVLNLRAKLLERWLQQRTVEDIRLNMKLYELHASHIQKNDKHEAYLETLIKKNEGMKQFKYLPENTKWAEVFKKNMHWNAMRIEKKSVFIRLSKNLEKSLGLDMSPERFSRTIKHYYRSWQNINEP